MTDADKRYWIRKWLDQKFGHKCALQGDSCKGDLIIDHKDGNRSNWTEGNLRWLCLSHNKREGNGRSSVCVVEPTLKDAVDYQTGSPEMRVNDYAEVAYRNWLDARVRRAEIDGLPLRRKEAINAGAFMCEISPATAERYLNKLTSEAGPFFETKDVYRQRIILRRKAAAPEVNSNLP